MLVLESQDSTHIQRGQAKSHLTEPIDFTYNY